MLYIRLERGWYEHMHSDSQCHLTCGSHRKQDPELTNGFVWVWNPWPWPACNVYDQVAALGAGGCLRFASVYFFWGVFISLSRHHLTHRIYCTLSGCLCASSCIHVFYVSVGIFPCLCRNMWPIIVRECELDTDIVMFVKEIRKPSERSKSDLAKGRQVKKHLWICTKTWHAVKLS